MTDNAFEREARRTVDEPLFDEQDLPLFERIQREFTDQQMEESVDGALKELPPTAIQEEGIRRNIDGLKQQGLWATARFYEKLLEKREAQEG